PAEPRSPSEGRSVRRSSVCRGVSLTTSAYSANTQVPRISPRRGGDTALTDVDCAVGGRCAYETRTKQCRDADVSLADVDRYASFSGPSSGRRGSRTRHALAGAAALAATVGLLTGCARFEGPDTAPFHPVPDSAHGAGINP